MTNSISPAGQAENLAPRAMPSHFPNFRFSEQLSPEFRAARGLPSTASTAEVAHFPFALPGRTRSAESSSFVFDLQLHADDDDELGDPPNIDIAALGDDPATLKGVIRTMLGDNRAIRKEAGKRRTALRTANDAIATMKNEHAQEVARLKAEGGSTLEAKLAELKAEHATALQALTGERDTILAERDGLKGEKETLTRSNGQLRSKFKERFVDATVRAELEKRGVHNVEDAMKLLDTSTIEFDEENLGVKDPAALTTSIDAFATSRAYLFGTPKTPPTPTRGFIPPRGASDGGAGGAGGAKTDFSDQNRSIDDIANAVIAEIGITA